MKPHYTPTDPHPDDAGRRRYFRLDGASALISYWMIDRGDGAIRFRTYEGNLGLSMLSDSDFKARLASGVYLEVPGVV